MPLIWCAISSHGYGHAAQVVPVLNELGRQVPGLRAMLRTQVPSSFFANRLTLPYQLSLMPQDVGCIQEDPLTIDIDRTWLEHVRFHGSWEDRLGAEVEALRAANPALVLSDIAPLAIAAARQAGIRAMALGSLSWDVILEPYLSRDARARQEQGRLLAQIRQAYGGAELMIRLSPGLPMPAFPVVKDIGPIINPVMPQRAALREALGATAQDRIALVAFGGIPLTALPIARMEAMDGWRFLVSGPVPDGCRRTRSAEGLPFSFGAAMISGDVILTKPGYSTIVEAVRHRVPVCYVRRYNFADEQGLVDYLHRYGRGTELGRDAFLAGQWEDGLTSALHLPPASEVAPEPNGAAEAASLLAGYL